MDLLKYGNSYESGLGENSLTSSDQRSRPRASDLGISLGLLPQGENNSITDVEGVKDKQEEIKDKKEEVIEKIEEIKKEVDKSSIKTEIVEENK